MIMDTVIVKRVMQNIIVRYVYDNAWNVPMPPKNTFSCMAKTAKTFCILAFTESHETYK